MPKCSIYFYLFSLIFVLISNPIQAFQQLPKLQQLVTYHQYEAQEDSLAYYENLLQATLAQEEDKTALFLTKNDYLLHLWDKKQITAPDLRQKIAKQKTLATSFPTKEINISAWLVAYELWDHLLVGQPDSAQAQLLVLQKQHSTQTLVVASAYSWLIDYWTAHQGTPSIIATLLNQQQDYLALEKRLVPIYQKRALAYLKIHLPNQAIVAYQQQLELLQNTTPTPEWRIGQTYYELAQVCYQLYNVKKAKKYLEAALNSLSSNTPKNNLLQAKIYILWAKLSNDFTTTTLRITALQKGMKSLQAITSNQEAIALYELQLLGADYYLQKKNFDSSRYYLELAQQTATKYTIVHPLLPLAEGRLFLAEGTPLMATQTLERVLSGKQIVYQNTPAIWTTLAKAQYQTQQYKKALKSIDKAIWLYSSEQPITGRYPTLASLSEPEKLLEALLLKTTISLQLYEQSQYNYSLQSIYETTRYNLKLLKNLQQELPQEHKLEDFTKNAALVLEQALDAAWLMYNRYAKKQYLEETFEAAELHKTIQLRKALKLNQATDIPQESLEKERFLQYQISLLKQQLQQDQTNQGWLQEQLQLYQAEWEHLYQDLQTGSPKYFHAKYVNTTLSIDSIQQYLLDSTTMVSYIEGKKAIYQLLLTSDTFVVKKIIWRTYEKTLQSYFSYLNDSAISSLEQFQQFGQLSYELYHKILHDPLISQAVRLVIIPDGLLHYLPFETLVTTLPQYTSTISYGKLDYLLQSSSISYDYAPSLWLSNKMSPNQSKEHDILGMATSYQSEGIPEWRSPSLHHLRQSIPEQSQSSYLLSLLQAKYEGDYYTEQSATEYYLKKYSPRYGILHLGFVNIDDALVLSEDGSEQEDNFLSIHDIKQLPLASDLVILPNTNSSMTETNSLVALGRAFLYAGSPALVVSLWEPKEASQLVLMNFYENLKNGLAKDKALQKAKIDYLSTDSTIIHHPSFWANYVQMGSTANISVREPVIHIWWFIIPIAILGGLGWWSMQALRQRK